MNGMRPVGDHLVVTLIEEDKEITTAGGVKFIIPDSSQDKPNRGRCVAVGEGRILPDGSTRPIKIKEGEAVLFSRYAGNNFHLIDDKGVRQEYLCISHDDVLVVLE